MSFNPTYPHKLALLPPRKLIANTDFGDLLIKARVELAELKGACGQLPIRFCSCHLPSYVSWSLVPISKILTLTLADVLQWQLFPEAEQRLPDKEVLQYREAMQWGFENVEKYSLSSRLIMGIQRVPIPTAMAGIDESKIKSLTFPIVKVYIPRLSQVTSLI